MSHSLEGQLGEIEGMLKGKGEGMDTAALLAMMNGNKGSLGGGDDTLLLLLFLLMGKNGLNGNTENDIINNQAIEGQIEAALAKANVSNAQYEAIKDAILGNGMSIKELATTLNCDVNSLSTAIGDIKGLVTSIAREIDCSQDKVMAMIANSGEHVINAIQHGTTDVLMAVKDCCCDMRDGMKNMTIEMNNQFNTIAFRDQAAQNQTMLELKNTQQLIITENCATRQLILDTAKDAEINALKARLERAEKNDLVNDIIRGVKCNKSND